MKISYRWAQVLLWGWLIYTLGALSWFVLKDPLKFSGLC
ncbi:hypothetical protein MCEMSEM47_01505 [Burkholderiales bacterium]